jgi:RNA polymerase sigma factor (sigma-70 family)
MSEEMNIAVVSKLKQGDLYRAMEEKGWTQKKLAEFLGMDQGTVGLLLNLKWVPKTFSDTLTKKLLDLTGKLPEDLFPESFREPLFLALDKTAVVYAQTNPELLAGFIPKQLGQISPEVIFQSVELREAIEQVLKTLKPKEAKVIRARFFENMTLAEVGNKFGVGPERVRQMENRALRDLRHPSRSRLLKNFLSV